MSYQATDYVLQLRDLTVTEKAVAFVLACHANEDGSNIYPSMETVAKESGLAFRQNASEIVHRLEGKKVIQAMSEKIGGRPGADHSGTTHYRFPGVPQFNLMKAQSTTALSSEKRSSQLRKCSPELRKVQSTTPKVQSTTARIVPNSKENSKEESGNPSFPLETEKRGQDKTRAEAKSPENGNSESSARDFFVWLVGKFPGIYLLEKQKSELSKAIAGAEYGLPILKDAACEILEDLDLSNSFDRSQGRTALVANLLDSCEAVSRNRKQRAADQEAHDAGKIYLERQAAEDRGRLAAARAAEAELVEAELVWD